MQRPQMFGLMAILAAIVVLAAMPRWSLQPRPAPAAERSSAPAPAIAATSRAATSLTTTLPAGASPAGASQGGAQPAGPFGAVDGFRYSLEQGRFHVHTCEVARCSPGAKVSYVVTGPDPALTFETYKTQRQRIAEAMQRLPNTRFELQPPIDKSDAALNIFETRREQVMEGKAAAVVTTTLLGRTEGVELVSTAPDMATAQANHALLARVIARDIALRDYNVDGDFVPFAVPGFRYRLVEPNLHMNDCAAPACGRGSRVSYVISGPSTLTFETYVTDRQRIAAALKEKSPERTLKFEQPTDRSDEALRIFESRRTQTRPDGKTETLISTFIAGGTLAVDIISTAADADLAARNGEPFIRHWHEEMIGRDSQQRRLAAASKP